MALTGDWSIPAVVFAVALGWLALRIARPLGGEGFARAAPALPGFLAFFLKELLLANLKVARGGARSPGRLRPAIVAVPLTVDRDAEIALLANLITLTPGTLSLDVSPDRRTLYVHAMASRRPRRTCAARSGRASSGGSWRCSGEPGLPAAAALALLGASVLLVRSSASAGAPTSPTGWWPSTC
jgi:multicomponent Na+:H+ antiporter subunit E